MQCPSCAAPIEADQQFGHFHVCPFCQAACVIDGEAAKLAGKMAVLADPEGPFAVDAAGKIEGRNFRVVGRVRHGHRTGYWDEWYLAFDDGSTAWVSEDEGELWLEEPHGTDAVESLRTLEKHTPGDDIVVAGASYRFTEKGIGKVEGGEGLLPEPLEPRARFRYYDLRGQRGTATIEIDLAGKALDPNSARIFTGRAIQADDVVIEVPGRRNDFDAERQAEGSDRKRVVKKAGRSLRIGCDSCGADLGIPDGKSSEITCHSCGTTLDLSVERRECGNCGLGVAVYGGDRAGMVTCRGCGSQLDASQTSDKLEVLQILDANARRSKPPVPVGSKGVIGGTEWRVVGYLRLVQREEGVDYPSDEMLLWSSDRGYAWLVHENGHFSIATEVTDSLPRSFWSKARKRSFPYAGLSWRVFERGLMTVKHVDGELSWVAQVGDKVRYCDATSPPYLVTEERTLDDQGQVVEAEYSRSRYLERSEVAEAFGIKSLPRKQGVAPHQPFRQSRFARESAIVMAALGVLQLVLLIWALATRGEELADFTVDDSEYTAGWLSPPFDIPSTDGVLGVTAYAPVDNEWVYLGAALVEAESEGAVQDLELEVSYYHGVEGGESWSEGSRDATAPFRAPHPGTYHLLIQGNAGYGETATHLPGNGPRVRLTVHQGWILARFFLIGLLLCMVWCAVVWLPRMAMEANRWSDD